MATIGSTSEQEPLPVAAQRQSQGFFSGRLGLKRREAALAYLIILPAMIIIGLFGIFPLIFSVYQSTRAGLNNIVGRPDGFGQYVRAIDSLAYVMAFGIAIVCIIMAVNSIKEQGKQAQKYDNSLWQWCIPAIFTGIGFAALIRWVFAFMPGLLEVGEQINDLRKANSGISNDEVNVAFRGFIGDAWRLDGVNQQFWMAVGLVALGIIIYQVINRMPSLTSGHADDYFSGLMSASFLLTIAGGLSWITVNAINLAIIEAIEDGEALPIWSQVITIGAGFLLFYVAWMIWSQASNAQSNLTLGLRLIAAVLIMIGGWILISELPSVIAEGKSDWWEGLATTTWYAVIALPIQLFLGLFLATLMFGEIKGQTLFRVLFFLPYITPQVGAAAAFCIIFSGNPNSPMNRIYTALGLETRGWLAEPKGIFELIAANFGGWEWTDSIAGPSLALVVAIVYGIWTYTGYNMIFFLSGLGNISKELYEAASIDGANRWQKFRNITFPLISPITYFLTIISIIGIFKVFTSVFVLRTEQARGTMDTASIVIFDAFNRDTRYGYASALGIILLVIIISISTITNNLTQDKVHYD